jgi:hypothetical protein
MEMKVQYDTVRKMKYALVNIYHASVENQGNVIVGGEMGKDSSLWMPPFILNYLAVSKLECIIGWVTRWFRIFDYHGELCRSSRRRWKENG